MPEMDGKVAIVTGAGRLRGIGRAAAVAFAKLGADVVVTGTGRDPDTFPPDEKAVGWKDTESTAEQVRSHGRRALSLIVDVTNRQHVQTMIDRAVAAVGRGEPAKGQVGKRRLEDPFTHVPRQQTSEPPPA